MLDLESTRPNFHEDYTNDEILPAATFFNRTEWLKEENHMRFVKEEENFSIGGLNPGFYYLHGDFRMSVRSNVETEDEVREVASLIPNIEQFMCVIVE